MEAWYCIRARPSLPVPLTSLFAIKTSVVSQCVNTQYFSIDSHHSFSSLPKSLILAPFLLIFSEHTTIIHFANPNFQEFRPNHHYGCGASLHSLVIMNSENGQNVEGSLEMLLSLCPVPPTTIPSLASHPVPLGASRTYERSLALSLLPSPSSLSDTDIILLQPFKVSQMTPGSQSNVKNSQ